MPAPEKNHIPPATALILAAGRGNRLGALTEVIPKCLLYAGGTTLIERQLLQLVNAGIRDIKVVTGFKREKLSSLWNRYTEEIFNPEWDSANNIVSLAVALDSIRKDFVLLNSDVLFSDKILTDFLDSPAPCALCIDDSKALGDEEMKITADKKGRIQHIRKTIPPSDAAGEYIGIAKFDAHAACELNKTLKDLISRGETACWYESAIEILCSTHTILTSSTNNLPWIEIDTPEDLTRAREHILPAINAGNLT